MAVHQEGWIERARRVLEGEPLSREEARAVLTASDEETSSVLAGARLLREHFHGNGVKLHVLLNAKSGSCPEDCAYCAQSGRARKKAPVFSLLSEEHMVDAARRAHDAGAFRFCMAVSGRGPSEDELERICRGISRIRDEVGIRVCASVGLLNRDQAARLRAAGVDRVNHNIETSERFFPEITTSHRYEDRVETVRTLRGEGLGICCGGIVGLGEDPDDLVSLVFALRDLGVDSIPVNFLDPRPGTPLEERPRPSADFCLRALSMFRFVLPEREIRAGGGREVVLGERTREALQAADSIFTEGYLTTGGNRLEEDLRLINEAGCAVVRGEGLDT